VRVLLDGGTKVEFTVLFTVYFEAMRDSTSFADGRHIFVPGRRRREDSAKKPFLLSLSCVIQSWLS
jgi:hypothetical protein